MKRSFRFGQFVPLLLVLLTMAVFASYSDKVELQFDSNIIKICPEGCNRYIACYSHSMHPTFNCKDTLIGIKPRNAEDIGVNDIIGFAAPLDEFSYTKEQKKNISHIIHRVVGKDYKGCYITKGDNNDNNDFYHPCFYDIIYVVKAIISYDVEVK